MGVRRVLLWHANFAHGRISRYLSHSRRAPSPSPSLTIVGSSPENDERGKACVSSSRGDGVPGSEPEEWFSSSHLQVISLGAQKNGIFGAWTFRTPSREQVAFVPRYLFVLLFRTDRIRELRDPAAIFTLPRESASSRRPEVSSIAL